MQNEKTLVAQLLTWRADIIYLWRMQLSRVASGSYVWTSPACGGAAAPAKGTYLVRARIVDVQLGADGAGVLVVRTNADCRHLEGSHGLAIQAGQAMHDGKSASDSIVRFSLDQYESDLAKRNDCCIPSPAGDAHERLLIRAFFEPHPILFSPPAP
jgi:hypothetical protein